MRDKLDLYEAVFTLSWLVKCTHSALTRKLAALETIWHAKSKLQQLVKQVSYCKKIHLNKRKEVRGGEMVSMEN